MASEYVGTDTEDYLSTKLKSCEYNLFRVDIIMLETRLRRINYRTEGEGVKSTDGCSMCY